MGGAPSSNSQYNRADIFRDAEVTARELSGDGLLQWADALRADLADDDPDFPGPVGRYLAAERLRAVDAEIERRDRLARVSRGVGSPRDAAFEQWRQLARLVCERVDLPELLSVCGHAMRPAGHNSRRAASEYAGACPVCGGRDRLRAWSGPNGRAWCRQCHWSADAIAVAQTFLPGCQSFRDAVKWLAIMAGAGVPR